MIPAAPCGEGSWGHIWMILHQGLPLPHSFDFWIACPCCLAVVVEGAAGWEFCLLFFESGGVKELPANEKYHMVNLSDS